ncbi:hypothetical protein [Pseudonocardia sp. NPDC049635]|uniref:hypothetical protein n=1 Tax=Pseudonocardia sp. NPDC049635 TaxID=3155506 RepID=UPI0033F8AB8D
MTTTSDLRPCLQGHPAPVPAESNTVTRDGRDCQLLVLDATGAAGPPVARVEPRPVVLAGSHGSWIPDAGSQRP